MSQEPKVPEKGELEGKEIILDEQVDLTAPDSIERMKAFDRSDAKTEGEAGDEVTEADERELEDTLAKSATAAEDHDILLTEFSKEMRLGREVNEKARELQTLIKAGYDESELVHVIGIQAKELVALRDRLKKEAGEVNEGAHENSFMHMNEDGFAKALREAIRHAKRRRSTDARGGPDGSEDDTREIPND